MQARTRAIADTTEPIPVVLADAGYPTSVLVMPVFVEGGPRRRRMLARWRNLAAIACLAYLVMLGVSVTASPVKPGSAAPRAPGWGVSAAPTPKALPAAPRVDPARTKVVADTDAAQDALVLRLAHSAPTHQPQPRLPVTRHRRDDDHTTSHTGSPSSTPVVVSAAPQVPAGPAAN